MIVGFSPSDELQCFAETRPTSGHRVEEVPNKSKPLENALTGVGNEPNSLKGSHKGWFTVPKIPAEKQQVVASRDKATVSQENRRLQPRGWNHGQKT